MRIVSLLPSLTEICAHLGLSDSVVGITHGCDYPPEAVEGKTVVTSTSINPYTMSQAEIHTIVTGALAQGHSLYGLNAELVAACDADVVLTQALCDVCAVSYPKVLSTCAKVLTEERPKVVSFEPTDLEEVFATILQVGAVAGVSDRAAEVVASLRARHALTIAAVAEKLDEGEEGSGGERSSENSSSSSSSSSSSQKHNQKRRPSVAFLEWTDPLFAGGHWVAGQVEAAGGSYSGPASVAAGERSRTLPPEALAAADPDVIFIAPCGFDERRAAKDAQALWDPKKEHASWWAELKAVKTGQVYALDANAYFARPGPRLVEGAALLAFLLHGVKTDATPEGGWCRVVAPNDEEGLSSSSSSSSSSPSSSSSSVVDIGGSEQRRQKKRPAQSTGVAAGEAEGPPKRPKESASRTKDQAAEVVDLVSDDDEEEEEAEDNGGRGHGQQAAGASLACPKCTLLNELGPAAKRNYKCEVCGASLLGENDERVGSDRSANRRTSSSSSSSSSSMSSSSSSSSTSGSSGAGGSACGIGGGSSGGNVFEMRSGGGRLEEIVGDLFSRETESLALCHCVSACLAMGKGIALPFKRRFGGVDELRKQNPVVGGCCRLLRPGGDGRSANRRQRVHQRPIYYLITKPRYFHKPTLDALRQSLEVMRDDFCRLLDNDGGLDRCIAMPRIGCGLDGLSWSGGDGRGASSNVRDLLLDVFNGTGISLKVFSLKA